MKVENTRLQFAASPKTQNLLLPQLRIVTRVIVLLVGLAFAMAGQNAFGQNPIQQENSLPGTPGWNDFTSASSPSALSGFGSAISVNPGGSITFYVTTTAPSFTISVYRTGYYQGIGARLVESLGSFPGLQQAIPNPDPVTGMIACTGWAPTTTLQVPSTWVSGIYLAKLTASTGNSSYIFFVVRNDSGHEDILFQSSVTTSQAYNVWGGTSLYQNTTNGSVYPYAHATKVSFDRPFNTDSNGAGQYISYEQYFVYWLEQQGYNVAYTTDVDVDSGASTLTNHKGFLSVGHDEYWSRAMRTNVQSAIGAGVNVGFFGADTMYWQIRFEPNVNGVPSRVQVGYKDFAENPSSPGPDPQFQVNDSILTTEWRDPLVNEPENAVVGVMFTNAATGSYVVENASNWVYNNTGFVNGSSAPGIVGYEYDQVYNNGFSPAGLTVLSQSPTSDGSYANSTVYTAPSGARVFASGTIEWSLGLANIYSTTLANAGIQQTTANILNNFITGTPVATVSPGNLQANGGVIGATSAAQTVTVTSSGSATLNINSIGITGADPGDFSETNNCPSTMTSGQSCTVSVKFSPTTTGVRNASVVVTDNANNSPQSIPVSGIGQTTAGPVVSLSPTNLNFAFQNVGTTSTAQAVALSNIGSAPLSISSIGTTGSNPGAFIATNNCPTGGSTLAVGASCTITVQFAPTVAGTLSANVTVTDNASDSPENVSVTGASITPTAYFQDGFESGNFSAWTLGSSDSSGQRTVQTAVVNSGNDAAAFTNTGSQYAYIYTQLPGGPESQTFTRFYFRTTSISTGTILAVARNANGGNTWEVDYDGGRKGLDAYFWNSSGGTYSLLSLSNAIAANTWYCLEIQDNQSTSGQAEVWLNGNSIGTVNADLSNANPLDRLLLLDEAPGTFYFDDVVISNVYNGPVQAAPVISISPASLNFQNVTLGAEAGEQAQNNLQTITIQNKGTAPLNFSGFNISGPNASEFSTAQCPSLAPNASCNIGVTFNPTGVGSASASLSISDNAPGSPQIIPLSGSGINPGPAVSVSTTGLTYGTQLAGTSSSQTITLTSDGTVPVSFTGIEITGTNPGDFSEQDNCTTPSSTLAVNASCTITVTFDPNANGTLNASLSIIDNAANSPQVVPLSGSGLTSVAYFSDGFESGNFSAWTLPSSDSSGQRTAQTTVVHSGTYAAALTNTSGQYSYLYTALPSGPESPTFTRFYFRLTNTAAGGILAVARNANGGNTWEVDYDGTHQALDFYFWDASGNVYSLASASNVIAANTWYGVEIQDTQTTAGQAGAWINGAQVGAVNANLSNPNPMARLMLFNFGVGTYYFDDVTVTNIFQ